ncbi:MAG: Gfo/Idh/MocA family oxidoreductase [Chloroflexi bacterium]|nr:Gfo/Idh/MocA family oxidoreductase [Chloroflexota bacterium]
MREEVGIGIIGAGPGGAALAKAAHAVKEARLVSVVASCEEHSRVASEQLGAERWHPDLDALLGDPEVQAVCVASPNHLHAAHTLAAVKAGKQVLCEKPMATVLADADAMIAAAHEASVCLMLGFTERFNSPFIQAKREIERGRIGRPVMIWAKRGHPPNRDDWRLNRQNSGDLLVHNAGHNIDLMLWMVGSPVQRVYAEMDSLVVPPDQMSDSAAAVLRFENGAIGVLVEVRMQPKTMPMIPDRSMEIMGTEGLITLDLLRQPMAVVDRSGWRFQDVLTWPEEGEGMGGAVEKEMRHFVECILEGREPLVGGLEGRQALEVALACQMARNSGRAVTLPLPSE